jgi:Fe-S cluster biogenesis protein NfuA
MFMKGGRGDRDVDSRIRETLVDLRPLLHIAEANIELVEFEVETGTAVLRVEGDCPDCEMSAANMIEGIAAHLRSRVPEVKDVRRLAP